MTRVRLMSVAVIVLLAVAVEVTAYGQEQVVATPEVPATFRGTLVEDAVYLKREFGPIGIILAFLGVGFTRGWFKDLKWAMPPRRHIHTFEGPVNVRFVRGVRPVPRPVVVDELEDASDGPFSSDPTPDEPTPKGPRPRQTIPPRGH